jgi:hypothetical protein
MAVDLPIKAIHRQIASALDLVVQLTRMANGRRMVTQISEVERMDEESGDLIVNDIFNARDGVSLQPTGYLPTFVHHLVDKNLLDLRFLYSEERTDGPNEGRTIDANSTHRIAANRAGFPPTRNLMPEKN